MSRGARRSLIPLAHLSLGSWPAPDVNVMDVESRLSYERRRQAVEMYVDNCPYPEIQTQTNLCRQEIGRLIKRCVTPSGGATITGFYALLPYFRIGTYERRADVVHSLGGGSGGCAGALTQMFARFPDVEVQLSELFLGKIKRGVVPVSRSRFVDLHRRFRELLRAKGLTDEDWPFNTKNCGYKALREYCRALLQDDSQRWIAARAGDEAHRNGAVGTGKRPIIPQLRPYSVCQIDSHKVDSASVIIFETEDGNRIPVPVARWHIGLMVEERKGAVLAVWIALETNPSGDSILELVEASLRPLEFGEGDPRCVFALDGKVFPNQICPSLAFQGFSVLKLDNAWAHGAHDVVDNIMETVGCAMNFGPVRAWWRRDLIERIFGVLTRRGLQQLPSTFGASPADSRRKNPIKQAVKSEITISELVSIIMGCVKEYNETRTESLEFVAPLQALQTALERPQSGLFAQPLPLGVQNDMRLMTHIEEVTVRGSVKEGKHVRPYVNLARWRYTNIVLANRYDLIGQKLIVYCSRRDIQDVTATVKETGEDLGNLMPPARWANYHISWRDRTTINNAGLSLNCHEGGSSIVAQYTEKKGEELSKRSRGKNRNKASKDALDVARILTNEEQLAADRKRQRTAPVAQTASVAKLPVPRPAPPPSSFGLDERPQQKPIRFGD